MAAIGGEKVPKGNWVARNLRLLNDRSTELFPRTPAEAKAGKFDSMYKVDYHDYPTEVLLDGLAPKGQQVERETIRDVLFGNSPTSVCVPRAPQKFPIPPSKACLLPPDPQEQTFANWRIPKRISGECEEARIGDHIGFAKPEKVETPRVLRQATLPAIPVSRQDGPKLFTPKPRLSPAIAASQPHAGPLFKRAKTSMADMSSSRSQDTHSHLKARAGQWKQRLPNVDARLLEKVLRMQDQEKGGSRQSNRQGTLLPDARTTVERWMETASEQERHVALKFFSSMAGGRLMGGNDQSTRLKDVINVLQSDRLVAEGGLSPRGGNYAAECDGSSRAGGLKYINLLDDGTRRQRWMHTTWHHLPNYRQTDPVDNWSSHYIRPHQAPHRHFVIHPDWPPQH